MQNTTVLVTGGTGFVAVNIIAQLLKQHYTVKTTLRSLNRKDEILRALNEAGVNDFSNITFYEADLLSDAGWNEAAQDCGYVLHTASPFVAEEPKDESEMIIPARDGALRVLKAAKKAGVKRVILTSSFAAIGYSIPPDNHIFTEDDWTDENTPLPAYIKSKTIAEKAAWDFIKAEGGAMEFAVINPVGIFGPFIGNITSASLDTVVKGIVEGTIKENAPFTFGVVDVRDVVDIHIKAMNHPRANGQRFLATAEGAMSFYDVAELIKKERRHLAAKIASMQPTPVERYLVLSNRNAVETLDWQPRTKEESILATVDSYTQQNA